MSLVVDLPDLLRGWCRGDDPTLVVELVTAGVDGWPHLAHLSCGEVVIDDAGHLRLAIWAASRGGGNLAAHGQASLMLAVPEGVFEIRLQVTGTIDLPAAPGDLVLRGFCLAPVSVRDKSAPYASITSALRFALHDPQAAHARWARVRQALLAGDVMPVAG